MVGVEEGREFRFRGDLYSQESTFPLVLTCKSEADMSPLNLPHGTNNLKVEKLKSKKRIWSKVSVNSPGNPWSQS